MSDILNYIEWRGDLTFSEKGFNDVDNLILSILAYTDLTGIVNMDMNSEPITLSDAWRMYQLLGKDQKELICDPKAVLEKCADSARFGRILIKDFIDVVNEGNWFQFSAMTFILDDGSVYVAFRGTDSTFAGWKEDLNFSFMEATPAQLCAAEYLDIICESTEGPVRVGGHSKGGNLAMYAAAFCEEWNKRRIIRVYSNDGPGFNEIIVENENYKNILDRVSLAIPEGSLIGMLLFNKQDKVLVQSTGKGGVAQHNPYTWCVCKNGFVEAEKQSSKSLFLDRVLDEWLGRLTAEKKQTFVDIVFNTLEASGAKTFAELYANKKETFKALFKAATELHVDQVSTVLDVVKTLLGAGWDVLLNDQTHKVEMSQRTEAEES